MIGLIANIFDHHPPLEHPYLSYILYLSYIEAAGTRKRIPREESMNPSLIIDFQTNNDQCSSVEWFAWFASTVPWRVANYCRIANFSIDAILLLKGIYNQKFALPESR